MILSIALFAAGLAVGGGLVWNFRPKPTVRKRIERRRSRGGLTVDDIFLAFMSHQFRIPLTNIIGYSELLQEDAVFLEQTDFVPDLVKIKRSGEHLLTLLDDVVDLSSVANGTATTHVFEIDLNDLLDDLEMDTRPLFRRTLAQLNVRIVPGFGQIRTDPERLKRALSNVVRQLVSLTGQGQLCLDVVRDGEFVVFTLTQDALKLSKPQVEVLMLDFSDVAATVDETSGAGLGLIVTREFCRILGGGLEVIPDGEGVKFVLRVTG